MRSVRFETFGDPADVLKIEDVDTPAAGRGEVLVRMRMRPINPSDVLTVRGLYGSLPELPATPGLEGVGVVEALGADVDGLEVGQRVIAAGAPGTWQEFMVANARSLIPPPDGLSDESAAQSTVNPLSAWVMLTEELDLQPRQWLLQTAAGSTFGRLVLQIAKLLNVKTINVVRRRDQVDELKALGADEVVCTEDEDLGKRVMEITDGDGVPAAIDSVGGEIGGAVAQVLGSKGVMLVYGMLSLERTPINGGQLIFRSSVVRGFWLTSWLREAPIEKQLALRREVLEHMANGEIVPPVEATFDLADVVEAIHHAEKPGRSGKVLLVG